ncbi:unnamed protein product [Arabidopsis halleri]
MTLIYLWLRFSTKGKFLTVIVMLKRCIIRLVLSSLLILLSLSHQDRLHLGVNMGILLLIFLSIIVIYQGQVLGVNQQDPIPLPLLNQLSASRPKQDTRLGNALNEEKVNKFAGNHLVILDMLGKGME